MEDCRNIENVLKQDFFCTCQNVSFFSPVPKPVRLIFLLCSLDDNIETLKAFRMMHDPKNVCNINFECQSIFFFFSFPGVCTDVISGLVIIVLWAE